MQLRLPNITTRFCVWWTFFGIYAEEIYFAAIALRGLDDIPCLQLENAGYSPSRFIIVWVLGLLPASIAAAGVGYFGWLAERLSPAWRTIGISGAL